MTYIVDYDLSLSHPTQRRAFYRAVHKILKTVSCETGWSTQSVIVIEDRDIAESIFELARGLGSVHIYKATKIK